MTHDNHDPGDEDREGERWPSPGMRAWLGDVKAEIVSEYLEGTVTLAADSPHRRFVLVDTQNQAYVAYRHDMRPYP
jgi:hypothetical protein